MCILAIFKRLMIQITQEKKTMLFILYGATLEMGYQVRKIFEGIGFNIIQKYNYVDDNAKVNKSLYESPEPNKDFSRWYNDKIYVNSIEEIEKCDFRYSLDGVHVGFNKQQIFNAVHGVNDALLTIGASSLDFILQLHKAYGNYITVLFIFSDTETVMHYYSISESMTESELKVRCSANKKMQQIYLDNMASFDDTVIYTGENSPFDMQALKAQFENIIDKRKKIENELNNKTYVELPYKGREHYLFVSYSHKNKEPVYNELLFLQRNSFRVWYDDGIRGGDNWRRIISDKIEGCSQFLLFVSKESCESPDVQAEINLALDLRKNIVIVNLDGSKLPNEYRMYLMNVNEISYNSSGYQKKLCNSLIGDLAVKQ